MQAVESVKPRNWWKSLDNQRQFLDAVSVRLGIKNPQDWNKVTYQQLMLHGGKSLLRAHGYSVFKAVSKIYPQHDWTAFRFSFNMPQGFWDNTLNQREFFKQLAKKYEVKIAKDWGKVTTNHVKAFGGSGLLEKYNNSLYRALSDVFSDIEWDKEWFPHIPKFKHEYWSSKENQRIFLNNIAREYSIVKPIDWQRVSISLLKKKGGRGLLKVYNNSIMKALQNVYKDTSWISEFNHTEQITKPQKIMHEFGSSWFPNCKIYSNYRHPDMNHVKSLRSIEIDVWIPEYKIAFEYNGPHHYRDTFSPSLSLQMQRDSERRDQCKKLGISLIEVPYWWNLSEGSLLQTRPDLKKHVVTKFSNTYLEKLATDQRLAILKEMKFKDKDIFMLAKYYNPEMDPKDWYLSEKYDGLRAYWDGSTLYFREGKVMSAPDWFKNQLPSCPLDGEIWIGRLSYTAGKRSVQMNDWKNVIYQVFDAPEFKGNFEQRVAFIHQKIPKNQPNVRVVSFFKCEGKDHLIRSLEETIELGGEGLVLRRPNSPYQTGRSNDLLKVKPYFTEKVRVVEKEEVKKTTLGIHEYNCLIVENKCGRKFKLYKKVSQLKFSNVKINSVITVIFNGLSTNGQPRFATVYAEHEDIKFENVEPYAVTTGSTYKEHVKCEGCGKAIGHQSLRIQVKGMFWLNKEIGREPILKLYSFCTDLQCLQLGFYNMQQSIVEFPPFRNRICVSKIPTERTEELDTLKMQNVNIVNEGHYLTEEYFTLDSQSNLIEDIPTQ